MPNFLLRVEFWLLLRFYNQQNQRYLVILLVLTCDAIDAALYLFDTGSTRTNRAVPYTVLISRTLKSILQYL